MPYKLFADIYIYFADYYLQEKNSWIVNCEMKTVRTAVLTMKINRMGCLFAKTEFSHFFRRQIIFKLSVARHADVYIVRIFNAKKFVIIDFE